MGWCGKASSKRRYIRLISHNQLMLYGKPDG